LPPLLQRRSISKTIKVIDGIAFPAQYSCAQQEQKTALKATNNDISDNDPEKY
jgi:hypothetical protein